MSTIISATTLLTQLNNSGSYSYSTTKQKRTVNQSKISAKDNCESINKSLRKLRNTDVTTASGKSIAKKQIKNILDTVEDLSDNTAGIGSSSLNRRLSKLNDLFDEYEDELSDLGITKTSKGNFSFDKTKIEKLTDNTSFETIFGKDSDFSKKLEKYSKSVRSNVKENTTELINTTTRSTVKIDNNKITMANSCNTLAAYINSMASADSADATLTYMKELIKNFNSIFETNKTALSDSEALSSIKEITTSNSSALNDIGIEVNSNGSALSFSANGENLLKENFSDAVSLFSRDFGSTLISYSQTLFCDLLETEKNNIKLNTYL